MSEGFWQSRAHRRLDDSRSPSLHPSWADAHPVFWRLHAIGTADFAIRPRNPATMAGGPEIRLITDDLRRYQLLELEQSWIIDERFEIEPLPQITTG